MLHGTKFSFETHRITSLKAQTVLKIRLYLNVNVTNKYMPMMKNCMAVFIQDAYLRKLLLVLTV